MRLLAEAKAHLDAAAELARKLEEEAGALPAVAGELSAAEERDDTLEGLI